MLISSMILPKLQISSVIVPNLTMFSVIILELMLSSAVVEERVTPNETVRGPSESQSLDWAVEPRIVLTENSLADSNDFDNPESGVSCDGMVGSEESEVQRELENSLSVGQHKGMVTSDCSQIVAVLEKEKDTENKGELKPEILPMGRHLRFLFLFRVLFLQNY
jgi:hypothetical protein